jgi:hypothetical protein
LDCRELHLDLVQHSVLDRLVAEIEVLDDVKVVAQRKVLVYGGDSQLRGFARSVNVYFLAVPIDVAARGRVDTGDDFDESGLSCAVVTDERGDLSGGNVEVNFLYRLDGTEGFRYPADLTERRPN